MDMLTELRFNRSLAALEMREEGYTADSIDNYANHWDKLREFCVNNDLDFMAILIKDIAEN